MAKILKGREMLLALNEETKIKVKRLEDKGIHPKFAIVRVGENDDDIAYERGAMKRAGTVGIDAVSYVMDKNVTQAELIKLLEKLNHDDSVHGVLLLRPLPGHINDDIVRNVLDPDKDVDGITDVSTAGVFAETGIGYPPCTPSGCLKILDYYGIKISGRRAVIIGRSMVVGKPLAMMLMKRNATVTMCHSRTSENDLVDYCRNADMIFVTVGIRNMIRREHVKTGQIVIDIGINIDERGNLCGDVDFDVVEPVVAGLTPVPGGVGATTSAMLMQHVVKAAKKHEAAKKR